MRSGDSVRRMKILQLVQRPQRRGAEVFAYQLSAALRRAGHATQTAYLYPHAGDGTLPLDPGDAVLGGDPHHLSERFPGANPRIMRRLLALIDAFDPDIIQLNGARTVKYGAIARRLRPGMRWRVVYRNIGNPGDWSPNPPKRLVLRALMGAMDGAVALTRDAQAALSALYPAAPRSVVIPNGVDLKGIHADRPFEEVRRELDTPESATVILAVGSLSREKRIDVLVRAFHRVLRREPGCMLWIVGEGPGRSELEALVEKLELTSAVRFSGVRTDVGSLMAAADIFALSSDTEGIPAVLLEAGYHRLPIVATAVGGIPECIEHGRTGLLVAAGDDEALAEHLVSLANDGERRRGLGEAARALVMRHYSMEVIAEQYASYYRSLFDPVGQPDHSMPAESL
jgi:glycosyltransferase involved in cell wall biosynthesis